MSDQLPIRILIVDDQRSIRDLCAAVGQGLGLVCYKAENAEQALQRLEFGVPDVVLADTGIGKGLEFLAEVKKRSPFTEVALMSASGTIESAVEAMRLGAYDFVVKPFRVDRLRLTLNRMVEKVRLVRENELLRARLQCETQPGSAPLLPCTDLEQLKRLTVQQVFERVGGDPEQAQKLLGISRATMYRKIKRYGIQTRKTRQKLPKPEIRGPAECERGPAERVILLSQS